MTGVSITCDNHDYTSTEMIVYVNACPVLPKKQHVPVERPTGLRTCTWEGRSKRRKRQTAGKPHFRLYAGLQKQKTHWHEVLMHRLSFHSSDGHWVSFNKNTIGMGLLNKRNLTIDGIYYVTHRSLFILS